MKESSKDVFPKKKKKAETVKYPLLNTIHIDHCSYCKYFCVKVSRAKTKYDPDCFLSQPTSRACFTTSTPQNFGWELPPRAELDQNLRFSTLFHTKICNFRPFFRPQFATFYPILNQNVQLRPYFRPNIKISDPIPDQTLKIDTLFQIKMLKILPFEAAKTYTVHMGWGAFSQRLRN